MQVFRRWYWITSAFFRKYILGIVVGLIIGSILVVNADSIIAALPIKVTERVGRVGAYTIETLPLDIQYQVSRGLTKIDTTGETNLDAAQTISTSDDATSYTVTLNPSLYWSDGTRLTTDDIELDLNDVEVIKESQEVLKFKLNAPFAPFPAVLSQPLLKRITTGSLFPKTQIIGLGEYRITDIKIQQGIIVNLTLESDTNAIEYSFFPTETEALIAFKLGKIDALQHVSSSYLTDWPHVSVDIINRADRYLALFFNTADPNLQDKNIRQLLAYATPKPTDESRVISPISADSWVYNPQVKPYEFNPEISAASLEKLAANGNNVELNFEITTTPAYQDDAQKIADSWNQLGITTSVRIVAFPDTNNYQILLIGQQIPTDPDQYALWHSTQNTNITKYQNAKIDKLLEDGRQEKDTEARKVIYQDFQRFLVEDSPAVFIKKLPLYTINRV